MYKLLKIFAVVLLAVTAGTSSAQFYSDRDHDQGTDTLRVYNSWQSIFFDGPDTVAVNPNVEIFSPFKFKFKPTEKSNKQLKNMIQKQSLALSLGDSVWFINSRYLRDSLNGPYNKIFEEYVPLYFNEKIAFVQLLVTEISYLPYEIDTFEGLTAGVGRGSMFNVGDYGYVDVPHFVLDLDNKEVFLVDRNYLMFLLERYPDMKHRYEMMQDQNEFYMINQFFWDYVERLSQDPYAPVLGVIGE